MLSAADFTGQTGSVNSGRDILRLRPASTDRWTERGTLTRAQVLRQIIESVEVATKYFNEAFAVTEYFGYLRRDPDALYLNWIALLNSGASSRTMVSGFVNSNEYRQRFGP